MAGLANRRAVPVAMALAAAAQVASTAVTDEGAPKRLVIKNGCLREPMWIAHEAGASIGVDEQNVRIDPGDVFHFSTPSGLSATRYWPKMGCNEDGDDCNLGGSGGPGESCVRRAPEVHEDDYSRCAPPVDTKFEGTFDSDGFDFVDMSLVDGWTLPFTLKLSGGECTGQSGTHKSITIDCSDLSFEHCPKAEELTAAGITVDLRAVNPKTNEVAGCYAPCMKLVSGKWNNTAGKGRHHDDPEVAPYCCPTPPESPEQCRAGPITKTGFLEAVHSKCPGVYGYAYDDGMGLLKCTPTSVYELTFFCPGAQTSFPPTTTARPTTTTQPNTTTKAVATTTTKAMATTTTKATTTTDEKALSLALPGGKPAPAVVPTDSPPTFAPGGSAGEVVTTSKALRQRQSASSAVPEDKEQKLEAALHRKKSQKDSNQTDGQREGDHEDTLIMKFAILTSLRQPSAGFLALTGALVIAGFVAAAAIVARRRANPHRNDSDMELISTPDLFSARSMFAPPELRTLL